MFINTSLIILLTLFSFLPPLHPSPYFLPYLSLLSFSFFLFLPAPLRRHVMRCDCKFKNSSFNFLFFFIFLFPFPAVYLINAKCNIPGLGTPHIFQLPAEHQSPCRGSLFVPSLVSISNNRTWPVSFSYIDRGHN